MTEPNLTTSETHEGGAPEGIEEYGDVQGRANALLRAMGQGELVVDSAASYDIDDDSDASAPDPGPAKKAPPLAAKATQAADDDAEAAAPAETDSRAKRLQEQRDRERAGAEARRREQAIEQERQTLAQERAHLQEQLRSVEPLIRALKDPDALLDLVADRVDPEKLSAAIPNWTSDEARAKSREKRVESTLLERLEAMDKKLEAAFRERDQAVQQAQLQAKVAEVQRQFQTTVQEQATEAPNFARLMARNPTRAMRLANEMATELGEDYEPTPEGYALVIRKVEEDLFAGVESSASSEPSPASRNRSAAVKANPLGNRASSDRSSIQDVDDDEPASLDDRVKRAMRALGGTPLGKLASR